eukprot:4491095-Pyramimonas_sp.AAC.1
MAAKELLLANGFSDDQVKVGQQQHTRRAHTKPSTLILSFPPCDWSPLENRRRSIFAHLNKYNPGIIPAPNLAILRVFYEWQTVATTLVS